MKKIFILILIIALGMMLYRDFHKGKAGAKFDIKSVISDIKKRAADIRTAGGEMIKKATGGEEPKRGPSLEEVKVNIKQVELPKGSEQKVVAIYLKHGGVMRAKLLEKTDTSFIVEWKGEKYTLLNSQVDHVEYGEKMNAEWKYRNDVVIVKNNGRVVDGDITDVDQDSVRAVFREGGGELEMAVPRKDIDHLLFAPVWNKEDNEILERLKKTFPQMEVYNEGHITLLTDVDATWVRLFKKELNDVYTDIYFTFFKLFKGKKPINQNFVIVFDDQIDYLKICCTDGTLGTLGYFHPFDKTLYLNNWWGTKKEKIYNDYVKEQFNSSEERLKGIKDPADRIVFEGFIKDLKDKFWDWLNLHRVYATDRTLEVLRHEFTHEVIQNWGLQDVVLPVEKVDKDEIAKKQKEIMDIIESGNQEKIEKLFMEMAKLRTKERISLEFNPANSWLVEGLATYCMTIPMGTVNEERLFRFQEMERKKEVEPIEFIMGFKKGSFSGLDFEAVLNAYAESWALTHFLMTKYRSQYTEYLRQMAEIRLNRGETAKTADEVALLLKCLGKDLPTLDKEFRDYMKSFPKIDDPDIKKFMEYEEIVNRLKQVFEEIGGRFV